MTKRGEREGERDDKTARAKSARRKKQQQPKTEKKKHEYTNDRTFDTWFLLNGE